MIRVTTQAKVVMPSPDQAWSLVPGSNHFDAEIPDGVVKQLVKLRAEGTVTIEVLDGASVTDWQPHP